LCTVLFADLSGFTACASDLSRQRNGAEAIGQLLNAHLRPLVELCATYGGDIVKFAGDAVLVCWPMSETDGDLRTTVLSASACGLAMQAAIRDLAATSLAHILPLRVGIATGPIRVLHLGASTDRRVLVVSGDGIDRATRSASLAAPGEVCIGRLAHQLVGEEVHTVPDGVRTVLESVLPLAHFEVPAGREPDWQESFEHYLPRMMRDRRRLRRRDWLNETRVVTAMFIHLPDLTVGSAPHEMNQWLQTAYREIRAHGGVTNKVSVDEKGATLLAVFGLPPQVHEDNASRACRAARTISAAFHRIGKTVSTGISTGRSFCGEIGGEFRREYTVIGDTVNTAARLMMAGHGTISTDRSTAVQARTSLQFELLPAVILKGKTRSVERYRPIGPHRTGAPHGNVPTTIGRAHHIERVIEAAQSLSARRRPCIEQVVGPAGIGKSFLAHAVADALKRTGLQVLRAHTDGIRSSVSHSPLRALLAALYGTGPSAREAEQVRAALAKAAGSAAPSLALVEDLLPVSIRSEAPVQVGNHTLQRARLIATLLSAGVGASPTAIVLDDAHRADPLTLEVLRQLAQTPAPLLVFLTTRPPPEAPAAAWRILSCLSSPIAVEALDRRQTGVLLAHRLEVEQVPHRLVETVFARSGGNPLFITHLADHLRVTHAVDTQDRRLRIQADCMERWRAELPVPLHALLLSRVDRLKRDAQFTLKVATIFGERFSIDGLRATHPFGRRRAELQTDLAELDRQGIVERVPGTNCWRFRHVLIRDALHEILSDHQRRDLQQAATRFLATHRRASTEGREPHRVVVPVASPTAVPPTDQGLGHRRASEPVRGAHIRPRRSA
jgi:class 3 adenylate cyclase